jgi:hypothetical protein
MLKANFMESVDRRAVCGLEGKVMAAGQLPLSRLAAGCRDEKLICPEVVGSFAGHRDAQHFKNGPVKSTTGLNIRHDKLNMVDQATAMEFLNFHDEPPQAGPS